MEELMLSNCGAGEDLRVLWTARSNQSILKEINPEYSLEGLMLKLKLQYFDHLMQSQLIGKDLDTGEDWREKKRAADDEIVRWCHQLSGHEFEQILGISEGQESLACYSPWGLKETDNNDLVIERLNNSTKLSITNCGQRTLNEQRENHFT